MPTASQVHRRHHHDYDSLCHVSTGVNPGAEGLDGIEVGYWRSLGSSLGGSKRGSLTRRGHSSNTLYIEHDTKESGVCSVALWSST